MDTAKDFSKASEANAAEPSGQTSDAEFQANLDKIIQDHAPTFEILADR